MKKSVVVLVALAGVLGLSGLALSHCEIPCGIYDDELRFSLLEEQVTTIEKSMNGIASASAESNWNQTVRWVENKEAHADALSEIVTVYFLTQRVKPVAEGADGYAIYLQELSLLHGILVEAMKAKQTTDLDHVQNLRTLIAEFRKVYMGQ